MFLSAVGKHFAATTSSISRRHPRSSCTLLTVSLLVVRTLCSGGKGVFMCGNSASSMAKPVIIGATAKHSATLIFLHGLGDSGHGWAAILEKVRNSAGLLHMKIVCPSAPSAPVSLNMGMVVPSWFDIKSLNLNDEQDEAGILASSKLLESLIAEELKLGIPINRIVIGGFSQGGAVALYTALTTDTGIHVGGVLALSTFLPLDKKIPQRLAGPSLDCPVAQFHGDADTVVRILFGRLTRGILKKYCPNYTFHEYEGLGHSSCSEELEDVGAFLLAVLPSVSS